jgi:hypothetical protein
MRIVAIIGMLVAAVLPLPRAVGPVKLGMPVQAFTRLTHELPDCTPKQNCGAHEARAKAFIDTVDVASGGLPGMQQFDCAFIRDSLFAFTTPPEDRRYSTMRFRLNGMYGAPTREDTTDSGLGEVIWQTRTTRLTLYYARAGKAAGTATGVEYADVRLSALADKDRGDKPWP